MSAARQSRELRVLPPVARTGDGDLAALARLAEQLVPTGFLPRAIRTPGQALAIILAGHELGIPPMLALRSINMVDGKVVLSADLQLALFKRDGGRAEWIADTDQGATLRLTHPNGDVGEQSFTKADADRAGLSGKDNWRKYPRAMMRARAATAALKAIGYAPTAGADDDASSELPHAEVEPYDPARTAIVTMALRAGTDSAPRELLPAPSERELVSARVAEQLSPVPVMPWGQHAGLPLNARTAAGRPVFSDARLHRVRTWAADKREGAIAAGADATKYARWVAEMDAELARRASATNAEGDR